MSQGVDTRLCLPKTAWPPTSMDEKVYDFLTKTTSFTQREKFKSGIEYHYLIDCSTIIFMIEISIPTNHKNSPTMSIYKNGDLIVSAYNDERFLLDSLNDLDMDWHMENFKKTKEIFKEQNKMRKILSQ